ncbi:MAG: ThiF family adenylyltransferase [Chthoniobacterales bacterium]|nr:ThiF family adenylyltransferase [Chthoniobacterales bacterium]
METVLRMTGQQHTQLRVHLFPGDGNEAVALALCGRRAGEARHILTVRKIVLVPYDACAVRTPRRVTWSTDVLLPLLEEAARRDMAILKIHSHPGGLTEFSETDDVSDRDLFPSVYGWTDSQLPHASAVMLPDGHIFGRVVTEDGEFVPLSLVAVAGDDLNYFWRLTAEDEGIPEFARRHAQAFGVGTFNSLKNLSIAVIGCSGTGSPVIEQLARLGVGKLTIVDPDRVEEKNLNRILNATMNDAQERKLKVDVLARAVRRMGTGTEVAPLARDLHDAEIVKTVAGCDAVFGCMDSVDGRHLLNRLAVFYTLPYLDVGVKLVADGSGGVEQICGTVHYLQPDRSSLLSRGVYSMEQVRAAALKRTNPVAYRDQLQSKYIVGVQEDRPAVISVNMQLASMAVNEFLARVHNYRDDGNAQFAVNRISLTQAQSYFEAEGAPCPALSRHVGRGDVHPLLDMPELSETHPVQVEVAA